MTFKRADLGKTIALAATYIVAARLGLALDAVGGFATLVWPPTGIAIAALLVYGMSLWPGVFVGAVLANILVGAPLVRLGIGIGNTLEVVLAAYALSRVPGFDAGLARLRSVVAFVFVSIAATFVGASIGTASLWAGGLLPASALGDAWRHWWLGDLIGAVVVAPVFLVWRSAWPHPMRRVLVIESLALLVVLVVTGAIVFVASQGDVITAFPQPYFLFPVLIWASQRFGPRGAALSVFIVSTIAVYGTVLGRGPFAGASIHHSLVELQAFMGVVATTFLVLAADVAERRAAEEDAMQARLLAEEANKAKADFLAVVSHELRTPLNAIAGYTDLLLCQVQGPLNEKQLDSLQRINRNYLHLLSLIDDVLGFTRVETGRLIIRPERVRVVDVIEAVEPMILPEANRKRIALQREPVDASLCVVADPDKMRQIVANLLSNAVKYTETGGHVSITAAASDGRVRIRIADSGIGIPTDQLSRVFDPFYQVERGTTRRFPGIGLGLTIARDLAFAMQGAIDLQSAPGQGTIVTLSFPAS